MAILAAAAVPHPPIILSAIGRGEEKRIQKTIDAYRETMRRIAALRPDTAIITSPHSILYQDYFHISPGERAAGDFSQFQHGEIRIEAEYDAPFAKALAARCAREDFPAGFLGERQAALDHGTMIPLAFLQEALEEAELSVRVVRIGLSGLSAGMHYRFGQYIKECADQIGRRAVFIASGDLSHKLLAQGPYGFAKEGPVFDALACESLGKGDFLRLLTVAPALADGAAECGLRSFWVMTGALDRRAVEAELLSYEGPFGVGYGVAYLKAGAADEARNIGEQLAAHEAKRLSAIRAKEDALVRLARLSLETYAKSHVMVSPPDDLPQELMERRAGAFVSIHKDGKLRGCIGTILPTRGSLAEEIIHNAVSAGMNDPRFEAVKPKELSDLVYDVDVLAEPEPIDSAGELDVRRYGVIVQSGDRRGLLLPDLAGVDTVEEQVRIARRKGNIGAREKVQLWRFEVERHV